MDSEYCIGFVILININMDYKEVVWCEVVLIGSKMIGFNKISFLVDVVFFVVNIDVIEICLLEVDVIVEVEVIGLLFGWNVIVDLDYIFYFIIYYGDEEEFLF